MKMLLLLLLAAPALAQTATPACPARPVQMGCANAANLAAMVADPADLVTPHAAAPAQGPAALLPIERYRAGKLLPLPNVGTDGATAMSPQ